MSYIFVSYSRIDSECAYAIQCQLEGAGYRVWIDKNDIDAGDPFPQRIIEAIQEATAVIVLWSENSAESSYVESEIIEAVNQHMHRKMPIIPVWLDETELHKKLESFNAIKLTDCSDAVAIKNLISKIPQRVKDLLSRKLFDVDMKQAFTIAGDTPPELISVPYFQSWYCEAHLVAENGTDVKSHLEKPEPYLVLIPQFLGSTTDATVQQAYESLKPMLDGQPFVCLHIKPRMPGSIFVNVEECGQALDAVNTTYEAIMVLVGDNRNLATVKLCTPMLSALSASIAYRFDSFWHLQVYHFDRQATQYHLLFDSKNL